jgi:predicted polyphosphate/ATP-dependent NAD kinase
MVGIIANPASGKDIRRLIASGTVVTNQEKINIIVRLLKAMDALGVTDVQIMPDPSHLGQRVINDCAEDLGTTRAQLLELPYLLGTWKDSHRAAELMSARGCACIIVMGGDGTSRIVTRACGDTPILPVSTGTNNVFPQMMEGTLAGMRHSVRYQQNGPRVVNIKRCLRAGAEQGALRRLNKSRKFV